MFTINSLTHIAAPMFAMVVTILVACESKVKEPKPSSADAKAERLRDRADELDHKAAKIDAREEQRKDDGPLEKLEDRVEEDKEVREAAKAARDDVRDANR